MKKILIISLVFCVLIFSGCGKTVVDNNSLDTERVVISEIAFLRFPFELDEPWEERYEEEFEKLINSSFECGDDDEKKAQILSDKSELVKEYIEEVVDSNFENETDAVHYLLREAEQKGDADIVRLASEYLSTITKDTDIYFHRIRVKLYKQYFENIWEDGSADATIPSQYELYAICLLDSIALEEDALKRIEYMKMIINRCPYNDSKLEILLNQSGEMNRDYEQGRISIKDIHKNIDFMAHILETDREVYDIDRVGEFETIIFILAISFDYEKIEVEYYDNMVELYGENQAGKLKESAEKIDS